MRNRIAVFMIASGATLFAAATGDAALVVYEGFDYAAGANVTGQTGGTGPWDSAWRTGPSPAVTAKIDSSGLSYPGLQVTGLAGDSATPPTPATTSNNFRDVGPFNSGDVWFSFLAKPQAANAVNGSATTSGNNFFGLSMYEGADTGAGAVMAIAKNSNTTKWGLVAFPTSTGGSGPHGTGTLNFSAVNPLSPDIVVDQTYLLVAHIHYATGSGADLADMMSLYIDPPVAPNPPAIPDVTYTDTMGATMGQMSFNRIRVASQNGRDWMYDEIRIGDSFADIVGTPEPGTIVSWGIVIGMLSAFRRVQRGT